MTLSVRVIPCLDVDAGRVVKGVNFQDLRDAGDPVELAARYNAEGADELVFLDITASSGNRETTYEIVAVPLNCPGLKFYLLLKCPGDRKDVQLHLTSEWLTE